MQIIDVRKITEPPSDGWSAMVQRPLFDAKSLQEKVKIVLDDVKVHGDEAIKNYTLQFDGVALNELRISEEEIKEAVADLSADLKEAIKIAAENIRKFHAKQWIEPEVVETMPGVECWRKSVAIEKVGLYIPGGTAPLFSTILMLAIPAQLAGCKEIVLCSPPDKNGKLNAAILFAAQLTGVTKIFKVGGVQAIGAMAYGSESVPKVYKIFGPGNQYVTCAKQLVQQDGIAIDMPAGPSEVCVLADDSANAVFVAADILSQAEHGVDSQVILVTTSEHLVIGVEKEIQKQSDELNRKAIAVQSLKNSKLFLVANMDQGSVLVNEYAPEHLIISCRDEDDIASKIVNAGSVFLGNYSPESVGDYASGTNHTLPTNGFARVHSGVSIDSFVKKITYQKLSKEGLQNIAPTVVLMAEAEGLQAHANAVRVRLGNVNE